MLVVRFLLLLVTIPPCDVLVLITGWLFTELLEGFPLFAVVASVTSSDVATCFTTVATCFTTPLTRDIRIPSATASEKYVIICQKLSVVAAMMMVMMRVMMVTTVLTVMMTIGLMLNITMMVIRVVMSVLVFICWFILVPILTFITVTSTIITVTISTIVILSLRTYASSMHHAPMHACGL